MNAYPLSWPTAWPRRMFGHRSSFGHRSIAQAVDEVFRQLNLMSAKNIVISSNLALRNDGTPRSNQPQPNDKGVAVYFVLNKKPCVLACDWWDRVEDNIWAIAKHVDALRGQQRWGVGTIEQAFAGYAALPPPSPRASEAWWDVLGLSRQATADEINARWRELAKRHHSDVGGNDADMARINVARDAGLRFVASAAPERGEVNAQPSSQAARGQHS